LLLPLAVDVSFVLHETLGVVGVQLLRPGDQAHQAQGIASVQRKFYNPPLVDQSSHFVGGCFHQRGVSGHADTFSDCAHREFEVYSGVAVQRELNALPDSDSETLQLRLDRVDADRQFRESVVADLVGSCKWHTIWLAMPIRPDILAKALSAGLGRDTTADELIEVALRVRHLERAYEVREGMTREDDTLPEKEFNNPVSRGWFKGMILERNKFEKMKDEYYAIRGWDVKTGIPTEETLKKFGLDDVAKDLKKRRILPTAAKVEA